MKPNFALKLSFERIGLLHRAIPGWHRVGDVSLDSADPAAEMAGLRERALALDPGGLRSKLVIPNEQIRYMEFPAENAAGADLAQAVRKGLDGATPYKLDELAYDWSVSGPSVLVAAVAKETLEEAEAFAREHRFNPVSFVAIPEPGGFVGEPFFGEAETLAEVLQDGQTLVRDTAPIRIANAVPPPGKTVQLRSEAPAASTPTPEPQAFAQAPAAPETTPAHTDDTDAASPALADGPADNTPPVPDTAAASAASRTAEPPSDATPPSDDAAETTGQPAAAESTPQDNLTQTDPPQPAGTDQTNDATKHEPDHNNDETATPTVASPDDVDTSLPLFSTIRTHGDTDTPSGLRPAPIPPARLTFGIGPPTADGTAKTARQASDAEMPPMTAPLTGRAAKAGKASQDRQPGFEKPDPAAREPSASEPASPETTGPDRATSGAGNTASARHRKRPAVPAHGRRKPTRKAAAPPTGSGDTAAAPIPGAAIATKLGASFASETDTPQNDTSTETERVPDAPAMDGQRADLEDTHQDLTLFGMRTTDSEDENKSLRWAGLALGAALVGALALAGIWLWTSTSPRDVIPRLADRPATEVPAKTETSDAGTAEPRSAITAPEPLAITDRPETAANTADDQASLADRSDQGDGGVEPGQTAGETATEAGTGATVEGDTARVVTQETVPAGAAPQDTSNAPPPETDAAAATAADLGDAGPAQPAATTANQIAALPDARPETPQDDGTAKDPAPEASVQQDTPQGTAKPTTEADDPAAGTTTAAGDAPADADTSITLHAGTGDWQAPPRAPALPATGTLDRRPRANTDGPLARRQSTAYIVLPPAGPDSRPPTPAPAERPGPANAAAPAAPDATQQAAATPEGTPNQARLRVIEGAPPARPPDRPAVTRLGLSANRALSLTPAEVARLERLFSTRPRIRPGVLGTGAAPARVDPTPAPDPAATGNGEPGEEDAQAGADEGEPSADSVLNGADLRGDLLLDVPRPRLRPQDIAPAVSQPSAGSDIARTDAEAIAAAVAVSLVPPPRPGDLDAQIDDPRPRTTSAPSAAPTVPSSASVTNRATERNAVKLRRVNLIGVFGTPENRRALVRLGNGSYRKVKVGDRLDGGQVAAIGDTQLRYIKRGENIVLQLPRG